MLIPSIDLQNGHAVQLKGGKELIIDAGEPKPILDKFGLVGDVAVIDLDAAMGKGSNKELIESLLPHGSLRVGGGIRDLETAISWLDKGAAKIIIGTAANPELLSQLPKERTIVALDSVRGEVMVEGWEKSSGKTLFDEIERLKEYTDNFLITFIENEGQLTGIPFDRVADIVKAATPARVTIAGGVATPEDIRKLDEHGADAQVGMAIYSGKFTLAEGFTSVMQPEPLWPTVVADEFGTALGLCWSNSESITAALESGNGVYWSRKRGLWEKGKTSGNTQKLLGIEVDCDRDALLFRVKQKGSGFCHLNTRTCWGEFFNFGELSKKIERRSQEAPEGSYTKRLFSDPELLSKKIIEEAGELIEANGSKEVSHEAADLLYFTLVKLAAEGVSLEQVQKVLALRDLKVTRRKGDAKW